MTRRAIAAAVTSAALLTSCGASQAPPPEATTSLRNVETIRGWDQGRSNYVIFTGCHGANRVYRHGDSIAVAGNDPTCVISPIR